MTDHRPVVDSRHIPGLLPWQSYFLAFVLGIFACRYPVPACVALGVLVVADAKLRGTLRRLPLLAVVLCAVFGFGYGSQRTPEPANVPAWMEARKTVRLSGVVESARPRVGGKMRVVLRDLSYRLDGREESLPGRFVWNWRRPDFTPAPGQTFSAKMRVVPVRSFGNPGAWDFTWYWQRQGVLWRGWPSGRGVKLHWGEPPDGVLDAVKIALRNGVSGQVPDTQGGAMVLALVTGDRSRLERETTNATRAAGLAHTLALSGLHVGFVAAMGFGLAWLVGWVRPSVLLVVPRPKLAVCLAAPLVLGYAWLGQPSHSLIRAATMFAFWGLLLLQGRSRVLLDGLFFALAVIVLFSPLSVFDLSLQMSAVAVAGIGLMYPLFRTLLHNDGRWWVRLACWAGGLLAVSVSANIALLPLVSWTFGTWSPNILLNLVWLPVLGFVVMPFGVVGMLLSVAVWTAPVGAWLLQGAAWCMDGLLNILQWSKQGGWIPIMSVLRPMWPEILGCALLLVVALIALTSRRCHIGLAGVGFLFMVWPQAAVMVADAQDEVRVSLIDVGQGQSALVSTPGGHRWLVDGGGGWSSFDMGEAVVAPYLTMGRPPRLDGVFMSHPDSDHSHGLPFILSRFGVGALYTNGMTPRGRTGKRMKRVLGERGMQPVRLAAGDAISLDQGIQLEILHPSSDFRSSHANEKSLVMRLVRRDKPLLLLPGDIESKGAEAVLHSDRALDAEVLVLPHHGSRSSLVPGLYHAVSPDVAFCSDGYLNRYGFPHASVVSAVGVPEFNTSRHGMVTAVWDESNFLRVRVFTPETGVAK